MKTATAALCVLVTGCMAPIAKNYDTPLVYVSPNAVRGAQPDGLKPYIGEPVAPAKLLTKKEQQEKDARELAETKRLEEIHAAYAAKDAENAKRMRHAMAARDQCAYEVTASTVFTPGGFLYQMATQNQLMELCLRARIGSYE